MCRSWKNLAIMTSAALALMSLFQPLATLHVFQQVVSHKSKSQAAATRSSNESETIAFSDTAAATLKIQNYLSDFGIKSTGPPIVHVDNANVIKSSQNVALSIASRHYVQASHWLGT